MSLRFRVISLMVAVGLAAPAVVQAGGAPPVEAVRDTVAVVRDVGGDAIFFTRSSNLPGFLCPAGTVQIIGFGDPAIDTFLAADFDGDGQDQPTVFRDGGGFGQFFSRNEDDPSGDPLEFTFGLPTDIPLIGNFDGEPGDEVGVFRPSTNTFSLSDPNGPNGVNTFTLGAPDDLPLVGDFDGNGTDEVGLFRPSTNEFFLLNSNDPNDLMDSVSALGAPGDIGNVGDWDADDTATIAVSRDIGGLLHFQVNALTGQIVDSAFGFGDSGDIVVVGDWDGPTVDNDGCPPAGS